MCRKTLGRRFALGKKKGRVPGPAFQITAKQLQVGALRGFQLWFSVYSGKYIVGLEVSWVLTCVHKREKGEASKEDEESTDGHLSSE